MVRVALDIQSPTVRAGVRALLSSNAAIHISPGDLDTNSASEADVVITTSASLASGPDESPEHRSMAAILILADVPPRSETMNHLGRAWGVLPTDASADELQAAVFALDQGLIVGTSPLLFPLYNEVLLPPTPLTEREAEVLELLAQGMANKQIANALHISEHTVKFHVSSIYDKLNVTNRTEAVRQGLRSGWIAL